ncbi:MAG: hypothetical protein JO349_03005, partial [Candidatus Eremiobacteraeota bacterium]|nr:hypothetical protein [Candidatus Eremiobacteraeota bacterium]
MAERLAAAPDFYRDTTAFVTLAEVPTPVELQQLSAALSEAGIEWDGAYALDTTDAPLPSPQRSREVALSDGARSLVADFAGARSDLAGRRRNGEPRRTPKPKPALVVVADRASAPEAAPAVLYHRGTLRGGQSLANVGHIVVVGDVN